MSNRLKEDYSSSPRVIVYRKYLLPPSETFIRQQVTALKRWCPVLFCEQMAKHSLDLEGLEPITLCRRRAGFSNFSYKVHRTLGLTHAPSASLFRAAGAQLIHVHFGTDAVDIWPQIRTLNLPILVTLHGYDINTSRDWWESGAGGIARRTYPSRLLRLTALPNIDFIAVSEAIRQQAVAFGVPAHKVTKQHIGIDTDLFTPAETDQSRPGVLFVGRLVEKKGVEYLIRACAIAFREAPSSELVIAGDGPLRNELTQLAASLGVRTRFLGTVTPERVRELLHDARVFCLPSITAVNGDAEGFGLVLLEAQASGVPVVTSARGGAQEGLIEGETGFSFPEKDVVGLATHLSRLLTDDDLHARQAQAAVMFVRQTFDLARCTGELETLYDRAVARTGQRAFP
jgi:glycosyltransferase involved in cell wall biosynthesis